MSLYPVCVISINYCLMGMQAQCCPIFSREVQILAFYVKSGLFVVVVFFNVSSLSK